MRSLVVIPTYDEVATIGEVLERTLSAAPNLHVLVVDDNSPDGTGDLVSRIAAVDSRVHVLRRPGKNGLGAAYRAGFAWGLDRRYEALLEMDADLSHPPERIPALLAALGVADVAIGSRYVPGGVVEGWPLARSALSRLGNLYVSLALRVGVRDATAGFRAYRRHVLVAIEALSSDSDGYCFQIELTDRARRAGFRVAEVPITFTERVAGRSKMSRAVVVEALARVTVWGVRNRLNGGRPHSRRRPTGLGVTVISDLSSSRAA